MRYNGTGVRFNHLTVQLQRHTNIRLKCGSQLAEFPAAIFILLLLFFFPLIDLLSVGASYSMCWVLNNNQTREACLDPWTEAMNPAGPVQKNIPDQWLRGMGAFVKVEGYPKTNIIYGTAPSGDKTVKVTTTVTCNPFLTIPLPIVNVPGLNGPVTFTIASQRQMENPDYAPQ